MKINPQIFRAYDIRGLSEDDLSNQVVVGIGKAFGTWLVRNSPLKADPPQAEKLTVAVGRDNRYDSDRISSKFVEGLLSTGCFVTDLGLSITPLIHFATIKYSVEAGVMVTASHNPKEFNGFRFDLKGAAPFYGDQLQAVKKILETDNFETGIGRVTYKENAFEDYKAVIRSKIKINRPLKVVIDCGNGASSKFAVNLFESLGFNVVDIFCNLDGDFPYHQPDPEERINLENLRQKVVESGADLGFAFDTDADRYGVSDEKGNTYENDKMMILLARDVLKNHPKSEILCDIKSSYVLLDEIKKAGGEPLMIKTGHPYFRIYLSNHDNVFLAGELSSHTFIKDGYYGFDDGLYSAVRVAQIVSASARSLSTHFVGIAHTAHTEEIKVDCPDDLKNKVVEGVGRNLLKAGYRVSDVDGFRINISPTAWLLIRSSNTSPYISLRFEAENRVKLLELITLLHRYLGEFLPIKLENFVESTLSKAHNV